MLKGKAALVTGSTSGIGLAIATALAGQGADIVLNGLGDADDIEATRAGLERDTGVKVLYDGADLLKPDLIDDLVRFTEAELGSLDILVNNAGMQFVAPVEEFPIAKWDAVIGLNLSASFHTIRAAVPGMKQRGWGRIVNIASAHALVASPYKSAYVAAKHGLAGLTKTVALELATHGITVNAICPAYVWTPLVEAQIPDTAKARGITEKQVVEDVLLASQPTKAFVTVEEVAGLACYLCSNAAASMTGSIIPIDGGWTAQ